MPFMQRRTGFLKAVTQTSAISHTQERTQHHSHVLHQQHGHFYGNNSNDGHYDDLSLIASSNDYGSDNVSGRLDKVTEGEEYLNHFQQRNGLQYNFGFLNDSFNHEFPHTDLITDLLNDNESSTSSLEQVKLVYAARNDFDMPYVIPATYFDFLLNVSNGLTPLNTSDFALFNDSSTYRNATTTPSTVDNARISTLIVYGVCIPLIASLGILLNLASFIVLTRRSMRSSVNIYLAGLSCFDGLLLLTALLIFPTYNYCETLSKSWWCPAWNATAQFTYPLLNVMQTGSIWTLTAITIDRFVAISWPLRSREYLTVKRSILALIAVLIWSIVYNVPSFFELERVNGSLNLTSLRRNPTYVHVYKSYCYLFLMFLIPAGVMIVLNVFVTLSVRKAYVVRRQMSGRDEKERRCTLMAVLVVGTFLVLNLTTNVTNCIEAFSPDSSFTHLVEISNLLVTVNSAINFFIYCALSQKFKQVFCKFFCPLCYTPEKEYKFLSAYFGSIRPQAGIIIPSRSEIVPNPSYDAGGIISMRSLRRPLISSPRTTHSTHSLLRGNESSGRSGLATSGALHNDRLRMTNSSSIPRIVSSPGRGRFGAARQEQRRPRAEPAYD